MYVKLFASIFQGSLRGQPDLLLVFINLLTHADMSGQVDIHWRAIADEVGISVDRVRAALTVLESPDPESRSQTEEGRRLVRLDPHRTWGWQVVNYAKYREIRQEEDRRIQNREAQRRHRAKADTSASVSTCQHASAQSAHAEAEAEAEGGGDAHARDSRTAPPPPSGGIQPGQPGQESPEAKIEKPDIDHISRNLRRLGLSSDDTATIEWIDLFQGRGRTTDTVRMIRGLEWIIKSAVKDGVAVRYARDATPWIDRWAAKGDDGQLPQAAPKPAGRPPPPPPGSALALALERRQGRELQVVAS